MFEITGDEIRYRGIPFATINGRCWPTMRDSAETDLVCMVTEDEISKGQMDEYDNGHKDGRAEGLEEGHAKGRAEAEAEFDKHYDKGFEDGRADYAVDVDRANQTERVAALLTALAEAHDLLLAAVPYGRKRAIKTSELKAAIVNARGMLRTAKLAYERPND